jgi:hypothetical protein
MRRYPWFLAVLAGLFVWFLMIHSVMAVAGVEIVVLGIFLRKESSSLLRKALVGALVIAGFFVMLVGGYRSGYGDGVYDKATSEAAADKLPSSPPD